jgi:hypothetical protein
MGYPQPMRIARTIAAVLLVSLSAIGLGCESHRSETDTLDDKVSIDSEFFDESREVWIHLPSGYGQSEKEYPVLYVLDAEWIFDFAASSVDFLSGEIAGRMPEMIVVGIPNTNRVRDLTVSFDTTAAYMDFMRFIESELIPFVDSTYRTNSHRVLYGWSSGSNICLWMLFTKPHLFHGYIASGTGISTRAYEFSEGKFSEHSYNRKSFFANSEGDAPFRVEALHLLSALLEQSSPDGLRWECVVMEDDDHTAVLPKGLLAGLEFLYSECRLPTDIAAQGRMSVMDYYHALSNNYGFDIRISEGAANDVQEPSLNQDLWMSLLDL